MLKTILLLIVFSVSINAKSQDNIEVNYKITLSKNEESKLDKMMLESLGNFHVIANQFDFLLTITPKKSYFLLKDKLYTNSNLAEFAKIKSHYMGRYIQENNYSFVEYNSDLFPKRAIVKKENPVWEITNETKTINNFKCYKATTIYTVINSAGEFKNTVEAWFCPEINYPFGPIGYGGLPGLIFELKIKDAVYGITSIDFKSLGNSIFTFKDFPIMTEEAFDNSVRNAYQKSLKKN